MIERTHHVTKIGIMGPHGAGKTTRMYRLANRWKDANPEKRVGIVTEVARDCPFPVNRESTPQAQRWIFVEQMRREIEAEARNDIVITDRTILDNLAYSWALGFHSLVAPLLPMALDWLPTYSNIVFVRSDAPLADDGFRDTDIHFRQRVEGVMLSLYAAYCSGPNRQFSEGAPK